jgi:spermidine/putrescine-binding protein
MDEKTWPTDSTSGISRAHFLKLSLAAGAAAATGGLLAACGGSSNGGGGATTASGAAESSLPVAPTGGSVAGPLQFYGWQGYDFPDATKAWRKQNDVALKSGYITTWQDIPPKLRAGQSFDVTNGDNAYTNIFEELGVLTRIEDTSLVPDLAHVNPRYLEGFRLRDGSVRGIPFSWGAWGIVYNTETVKAVPTKWSDLLEPEFKGRLGMLDDVGPSVNIAAIQNGVEDPAKLSQSQLNDAIAYVTKMKDQAKAISPSWGDVISLLEKGEVDVVWEAWPALKLFVGKGVKLGVNFPEDRSVSYVNTYWVPKTAKHPAAAYGFMNEVLTPEAQVQIPAAVGEAIVRTELASKLPKDLASLYPYNAVDAFLNKNPLYTLPKLQEAGEVTSYTDWQNAWNQMKG